MRVLRRRWGFFVRYAASCVSLCAASIVCRPVRFDFGNIIAAHHEWLQLRALIHRRYRFLVGPQCVHRRSKLQVVGCTAVATKSAQISATAAQKNHAQPSTRAASLRQIHSQSHTTCELPHAARLACCTLLSCSGNGPVALKAKPCMFCSSRHAQQVGRVEPRAALSPC